MVELPRFFYIFLYSLKEDFNYIFYFFIGPLSVLYLNRFFNAVEESSQYIFHTFPLLEGVAFFSILSVYLVYKVRFFRDKSLSDLVTISRVTMDTMIFIRCFATFCLIYLLQLLVGIGFAYNLSLPPEKLYGIVFFSIALLSLTTVIFLVTILLSTLPLDTFLLIPVIFAIFLSSLSALYYPYLTSISEEAPSALPSPLFWETELKLLHYSDVVKKLWAVFPLPPPSMSYFHQVRPIVIQFQLWKITRFAFFFLIFWSFYRMFRYFSYRFYRQLFYWLRILTLAFLFFFTSTIRIKLLERQYFSKGGYFNFCTSKDYRILSIEWRLNLDAGDYVKVEVRYFIMKKEDKSRRGLDVQPGSGGVCFNFPPSARNLQVLDSHGVSVPYFRMADGSILRLSHADTEIYFAYEMPKIFISDIGGVYAPLLGWKNMPVLFRVNFDYRPPYLYAVRHVDDGRIIPRFEGRREDNETPVKLTITGIPKDWLIIQPSVYLQVLKPQTFQPSQSGFTISYFLNYHIPAIYAFKPEITITKGPVHIYLDKMQAFKWKEPALEEIAEHLNNFFNVLSLHRLPQFHIGPAELQNLFLNLKTSEFKYANLTLYIFEILTFEIWRLDSYFSGDYDFEGMERFETPLPPYFAFTLTYLFYRKEMHYSHDEALQILRTLSEVPGKGERKEFFLSLGRLMASSPGFEKRLSSVLNGDINFSERKLTQEEVLDYLFEGKKL